MLPVTKYLIGIQCENWPDKAPFGLVVQHDGVFQELEGTLDSLDGALSIPHWDGEGIWGHLICSVFSRPAGDLFSKALPVKNKDITQLRLAGKKGALGLEWREGEGVAQGHRATEANMAAVWQLVKIPALLFL